MRIFIVAGEISSDYLGAKITKTRPYVAKSISYVELDNKSILFFFFNFLIVMNYYMLEKH